MPKTISLSFRLTQAEKNALDNLAKKRGVSSSEIIRRLIREAVFHGPTFFDDQLRDYYHIVNELRSVGKNLNQITKRVHRGEIKVDPIKMELMATLFTNIKKTSDLARNIFMASKNRRATLREATLNRPSSLRMHGAAPPGQSSP